MLLLNKKKTVKRYFATMSVAIIYWIKQLRNKALPSKQSLVTTDSVQIIAMSREKYFHHI